MSAPLPHRPPSRRAKLVSWQEHHSGSLVGFAAVRFPSGLEIHGITVHVAGSRAWASPPGKPWLDADGELVREPDGRPRYARVIGFASHGVRSRWSRTVLEALKTEHPEVLADVDPEQPELEGEGVA